MEAMIYKLYTNQRWEKKAEAITPVASHSSELLINSTPMGRSSFVFGLGFIVTLFVHCFPKQFREVFQEFQGNE